MCAEQEDQKALTATLYADMIEMISSNISFEGLDQKLFVFSPFEALGVVDYEIRHGNFLAHLFNPNAPHGFGDAVLVAFLKQLLGSSAASTKLAQIVINGAGSVLIRREWHNIDIVIELNDPKLKTVIVVELKVHAKESSGQLTKYTEIIEKHTEYTGYDKLYVFMTPDGAIASHEGWRDFNMTAGFIDALKQLTRNDNGHETARAMLADYIRIMEQKFMTEKELDDLAQALWARYPDALNFLADSRPDIVSRTFDNLYESDFSSLDNNLGALGFDFTNDWEHETNSRLIYTFSNWDNFPNMLTSSDKRLSRSRRLMWLELVKSSNGIQAMFIIGPGDADARRNLLQALIDGHADTGSQKSTSEMSGESSRLSSVWLFDNKAGDKTLADLEIVTDLAIKKLDEFLTTNLPSINKAIESHAR